MTKKLKIIQFIFRNCQITNHDIIDFVYLLKDNKEIKVLDLSKNKLNTSALNLILNAAKYSSLQMLILDDNKITEVKYKRNEN